MQEDKLREPLFEGFRERKITVAKPKRGIAHALCEKFQIIRA